MLFIVKKYGQYGQANVKPCGASILLSSVRAILGGTRGDSGGQTAKRKGSQYLKIVKIGKMGNLVKMGKIGKRRAARVRIEGYFEGTLAVRVLIGLTSFRS